MKPALFVHVPKTGGNTIKASFGPRIFSRNHTPARRVRELRDAPWSFAFVRNPWNRMLSWYFWSEPASVLANTTRTWFSSWVMTRGSETFRTVADLILDENGTQLVSTVYQFEDFAGAYADIAVNLGVLEPPVISVHNENPNKPAGWPRTAREFYTPAARNLVAKRGAWEIERFGYEFDKDKS